MRTGFSPTKISTTIRKTPAKSARGTIVTALYELVPAGQEGTTAGVDPLEFQKPKPVSGGEERHETMMVKLRYKAPEGDVSKLIKHGVVDEGTQIASSTADFRFASAVAGFGMLLRDSPHKGNLTWAEVKELAESGIGKDKLGYRREFLGLVEKARELSR